jgi:iron(III) transport system permease protein
MLTAGTFMRLFGFFNLTQAWTLQHWAGVLNDPLFVSSLRNTFVLALGVALVGVPVFALTAYVCARTTYTARPLVELVSWLPASVPGMILGFGFLWLFLGSPLLRPLYNTIVALLVALLIAHLTLGVQIIRGHLQHLGRELEEVARVSGASWWDTTRRVLVPLLAPVLALVGSLTFAVAARDVSTIALLASSSSRPLSLLQLDYMVEGEYEKAAVVGLLLALMTGGAAMGARVIGGRIGIK